MNIHNLISLHGRDNAREMVPEKERHLVDLAAETMACEDFADDVGYLYSGFAMTALPHRRPAGDREFQPWTRENGKFRLIIEPGYAYSPKFETIHVGIPFGSRARLILFYLQTEAIRNQSTEVELGSCLGKWLARMGIPDCGLNYQSVREQCRRLSACHLTIGWQADDGSVGFERANITNRVMFVPTFGDDRQGTLWTETVRLSPEFFESLVSHPVPVAEHGIKSLCNSSLSMDVYVWLAYRLRALNKPTAVSWSALRAQFGPEYATVRSFKSRFVLNLKEALCVYPDARVEETQTGIILHPSPPAVPERAPVRRLQAVR